MTKKILTENYNLFVEAVDVEDMKMIESTCKYIADNSGPSLAINIKETFKYSLHENGFVIESRWALKATTEEKEGPAVTIVAKYLTSCTISKEVEVTKELVDVFFDRSIAMLGWVYFREHVNSSVVKMGLPSLTLPLRKR